MILSEENAGLLVKSFFFVVFLLAETEISMPCWPGWPWKLDLTGSIMNPKPTFTVASSQVRHGHEKRSALCLFLFCGQWYRG